MPSPCFIFLGIHYGRKNEHATLEESTYTDWWLTYHFKSKSNCIVLEPFYKGLRITVIIIATLYLMRIKVKELYGKWKYPNEGRDAI